MNIKEFTSNRFSVRPEGVYTTETGRTKLTPVALANAYTAEFPTLAQTLAPLVYAETITELHNESVAQAVALAEAQAAERATAREGFAQDEDEYIKGCMDDEQITPNSRYREFNKLLTSGEYKTMDVDDIEIILRGRLSEYNRGVPAGLDLPTFRKEDVVDRFRYLCKNATATAMADMHTNLRFKAENQEFLDKWIYDLIDVMHTKTDRDVAFVVIKHLMWQVKRRVFNKAVLNDLWVAWFGAQGKGKSYIMKKCLFKEIEAFYCETQLGKIDDIDREIRKFSDNFVVNFEELAVGGAATEGRSNKVNNKTVANLKSILTADKLYIRQMGGQTQMTVNKTFVPISTANERLYDVVYDESGMRRFFQIDLETPEGLATFDQAKVKELADTSLEAWRGVCEWDDKPVWDWNNEIGKKILAIQKTYRPHTNVNDWIEAGNYCGAETPCESAKTLYKDYKNFCKECGYIEFGIKKFTEQLQKEFKFEHRTGRGIYFAISTIAFDIDNAKDAPSKKKEML